MTRILLTVVVAATLLSAPTLIAHEGHAHKVMGTVSVVHENHVEVKDAKGKALMLTVDAKSKVWRGKSLLRASEIKAGERVVVTYEQIKAKDGKVTLLVKMIQLGVTPVAAKNGAKR